VSDIYFAARFGFRTTLKKYRAQLHDQAPHHNVVGTWIDEEDEIDTEEYQQRSAMRDIRHIELADIVCTWMLDEPRTPSTSRNGFNVEFGYGLGLDKTMLLVGPRTCVFHFCPP
jgi:nucleoside 2-deoxyribosyltransferase